MNSDALARRVSATPGALTIEWADGGASEFLSIWLSDNRPDHRDAYSGQRLIDILDLPLEPRIHSAILEADSVRIHWEGQARETAFELSWLARHASGERGRRAPELATRLWLEGGSLEATRDFAWSTVTEFRESPAARLTWLTALLQDGVAFLRGLPCDESALLNSVEPIGQVLETNYGRVFDVRSVPQPENLAYSDLGLGLHTDNPYREPVPGFQALHAMVTSTEGGESLFADGFAMAEHLRATEPEAFRLLTQTAVPFSYRAKDADLYAERPLIQLSCDGTVAAVHYNSRSIAPLRLEARDLPPFYASYRLFAGLLRNPRFQLKLRLADGDLVVFDNRRILHGRTAFSAAKSLRHLRGCYLTRDSVYSETALLRRKLS
jgi:alpha-ketoglutarate-dependent taurine dioxygenase